MHKKPYRNLALGGTFDHFHVGHQHFIDFAAQLSEKLIIGLTTNKLIKNKKYQHSIEDFHTRKKISSDTVKKNNYDCLVIPLEDPYGPTIIREEKINALAVTEFTTSGAKAINELRLTMGMRSLPTHVCPMLKDENGQTISSTRIRSGEINRKGEIYFSSFSQDIKISDNTKNELSKIQGRLVENIKNKKKQIILVGDTTFREALAKKWKFNLVIFDKKEQRKEVDLIIDENKINLFATNPAGEITNDLAKQTEKALKENLKYLFVRGEEDLATLVVVLLSSLGSYVYYGQPDQGLVEIKVDERIKEKFANLLKNN